MFTGNSILISSILAVTGGLWGIFRQKSQKVKKIDAAIQKWAPVVYDVVNNIVLLNPNGVHNKPRMFAQEISDVLEAEGIRVTPQIITQAQAIADSLHYQDKVSQKSN